MFMKGLIDQDIKTGRHIIRRILMTVQLPAQDPFTSYDYALGESRRKITHNGNIVFSFNETLIPYSLASMNIEEKLNWLQLRRPTKINRRLVVVAAGTFESSEVSLLTKCRTAHLAAIHLRKWGKQYGEIVLSSTETGSLYWNVIHHFRSFANMYTEFPDKFQF
jgi:hypothetical protein